MKIWSWFKNLTPMWLRGLVALLVAILVFLFSIGCSAPKSVIRVHNKADKTTTTIHQTTGDGGSVSVTVTPKLEVSIDSTHLNL